MPRTAEKAQLAGQLQNTWLANILLNILFNDEDMELLQQFLGPGPIQIFSNQPKAYAFENQIYSDSLRQIRGGDMGLEGVLGIGTASGLEESEEQEKEIERFIGFLGIALQEIRYLAPRVPIPRSEYLFTHHVC